MELEATASPARTASSAPCTRSSSVATTRSASIPATPNGQDDVLVASPEVHLPIGKPVKVLLRSNDVLHNFSVAQIRVKMDLVPGLVTHIWFTPTRTGAFDLLCEELCGIGHFAMRGRMVVDEEAAFRAWLDAQPTYAQWLARPSADAAGRQAALYAACAACHGAQGEGNPALNAPKLTGQGAWYLQRQLRHFKQRRARCARERHLRQDDGADGRHC